MRGKRLWRARGRRQGCPPILLLSSSPPVSLAYTGEIPWYTCSISLIPGCTLKIPIKYSFLSLFNTVQPTSIIEAQQSAGKSTQPRVSVVYGEEHNEWKCSTRKRKRYWSQRKSQITKDVWSKTCRNTFNRRSECGANSFISYQIWWAKQQMPLY